MSKLTESFHFVPLEAIPTLSGRATVGEVLETMRSRQVGGALLLDPDAPVGYVRGDELHKAVLEQAKHVGWDLVVKKPVTELFRQSGRRLVAVRKPDPAA